MHIVLIHPEIPQNTGAIGRLCVGIGAPLHIIRPFSFSLDEKHLRRAGMDYWQHLELHLHDSIDDFLSFAKPTNLWFFSTKSNRPYTSVHYQPNDALLFGAESRGLAPEYHQRFKDNFVTIPMPGEHARSINLANSVGIGMYEAFRQINLPKDE